VQEPAIDVPQAAHQLKPGGYGLGSGAHCGLCPEELPIRLTNDRKEAAGKAHGVPAAMPQGKELSAYSVDRSSSERGNHRVSFLHPATLTGAG